MLITSSKTFDALYDTLGYAAARITIQKGDNVVDDKFGLFLLLRYSTLVTETVETSQVIPEETK